MYHDQMDFIAGSVFDAVTTNQKNAIGKKCVIGNRTFHYGSAIGVVTVGNILAGQVVAASHLLSTASVILAAGTIGLTNGAATVAGTGGAIGDTTITINTIPTTSILEDDFEGGTLTVQLSTGLGYSYTIKGNDAITFSSGVGNIYLKDPLIVALSATSVVTLHRNPYKGMILSPASGTNIARVLGGAVRPFTAGTALVEQFGWIQTWGVGPAYVLDTPTIGQGLVQGTTAGELIVGTTHTAPIVAELLLGGITAHNVSTVYWRCDP